jgi:hypothetical protein
LLSAGPTRIPRPRGLLAARRPGIIDEELVLLTPDGDDAPAAPLHHLTQQK